MALCAPSEDAIYSFLEALITTVNEHAAKERYVIITKCTKKSKKGNIQKAWLICDKGRKALAEENSIHDSSSHQTNCPFDMIALQDLKTGQ